MVRSVLSNWVALAVTGALSFFLTPILLRGLGDFQFGMWVLVGSALDHYGLLDMGIRTTLQRFVARYRGTDERRALSETFATALAIGFGVCVVAGVLSFVLSRVLPPFFGLSGTNAIAFSRLVVLLGLSVAVTFPVQVLGAYLCGIQRFDLFNLSGILAAVVRAPLRLRGHGCGRGDPGRHRSYAAAELGAGPLGGPHHIPESDPRNVEA
jgi:O-antigen/teichoic acid export membrane protein